MYDLLSINVKDDDL